MIEIYGASDDLIEVSGQLSEEFNPINDKESYLVFSDGTVLEVIYGQGGFWRINRLVVGTSNYRKEEGTDPVENYSDHVFLEGDISWVVFGSEFHRKARA